MNLGAPQGHKQFLIHQNYLSHLSKKKAVPLAEQASLAAGSNFTDKRGASNDYSTEYAITTQLHRLHLLPPPELALPVSIPNLAPKSTGDIPSLPRYNQRSKAQ